MKQNNTNTRLMVFRVQDLLSELDQVNNILVTLNSFKLYSYELHEILLRQRALAKFKAVNLGNLVTLRDFMHHRVCAYAVVSCVSPRCILRTKYEGLDFEHYCYDVSGYNWDDQKQWSAEHDKIWQTAMIMPFLLSDIDDITSLYCSRGNDEIRWTSHQAFSDLFNTESYLLATRAKEFSEGKFRQDYPGDFLSLEFEYPREDTLCVPARNTWGQQAFWTTYDNLLYDAMTLYDAAMFHLVTSLNICSLSKEGRSNMARLSCKIGKLLGGIHDGLESVLL